jgi:hypothetical protein
MSKLFKNGVLNSLLITVFLVIIIGSTLLYIPTLYTPTAKEGNVIYKREKISTTLTGIVRDIDGNIKYQFIKEDDLITKQFIDFTSVFFSGVTQTADVSVVLKNDANTDKTFTIWSESSTITAKYSDSATGTSRKGGLIGIGTGTTAPARTNYALETKVESYADITTVPVWDTSTGIVSATANIAITGSRTITEACIGVRWIDTASSEQVIIFAHDTFAGVSVVNTDVFSLTYAFTLSSGFTNNMGIWLVGLFTSIADGANGYITFKDMVNSAQVTYQLKTTYTTAIYYCPTMSALGLSKLTMGTSSTAIARTDYKCTVQVEGLNSSIIIADTTGVNINGIIFSNTARTIKEVAFNISPATAGYIVFIHLLTGDVALNAKDGLVIKIRVDM